MAQTEAKKFKFTEINSQFLNNLIIHFITASTCFLICTYPYIFSSMQYLEPIFLPYIYSLFSNPKFLFFVVNLIVAFLVKESNLLDPPTSTPSNDMYDDYIQRSQRIRRVNSSHHVQEKKYDNLYKRAEASRVVIEKKSSEKCGDSGEKQRVQIKGDDSQVKAMQEAKKKAHCSSSGRRRKSHIHEKEKYGQEEIVLPADELNKRADAFIARVNRQRLLEIKVVGLQ